MRNFVMELSYDGSSFYGYQRQPGRRTIQSELEGALKGFFKEEINTSCSGRTDRGVHALKQVVSFKSSNPVETERIREFLMRSLPTDIQLLSIREESLDFHPRFSAKSRSYIYRIKPAKEKTPFNERYYCFADLDREKFKQEIMKFEGIHDFQYFSTKLDRDLSTRREIYNISFTGEDYLDIKIDGNSFLRGMVRVMIGTAILVSKQKLPTDFIEKALLSGSSVKKNRAPAQGLYLSEINY